MTVVLVVEDDADTRELFAAILGHGGYQVVQAEDGAAALELLDTVDPALVVTDVAMPRMDGIALLRALRLRPQTARVPVVVVTSLAGARGPAEAAGCTLYLPKPLVPMSLLNAARRLAGPAAQAPPLPG